MDVIYANNRLCNRIKKIYGIFRNSDDVVSQIDYAIDFMIYFCCFFFQKKKLDF